MTYVFDNLEILVPVRAMHLNSTVAVTHFNYLLCAHIPVFYMSPQYYRKQQVKQRVSLHQHTHTHTHSNHRQIERNETTETPLTSCVSAHRTHTHSL